MKLKKLVEQFIEEQEIDEQAFLENVKSTLGLNYYSVEDPENLPQNREELDVHMQLDYKQSIEIAEEELPAKGCSRLRPGLYSLAARPDL